MNFKLGTELHGFTVESVDKIEKINQCVYQLKYKKKGSFTGNFFEPQSTRCWATPEES